jgi:hypothetical protein
LAAYVVGSQPHDLHIKYSAMEYRFNHGGRTGKAVSLRSFHASIDELRNALTLLAGCGQASAGGVAYTITTISNLEVALAEVIRQHGFLNSTEDPDAMDYGRWLEFADLTAQAIGPDKDLQTWGRLGAAVGRARYELLWAGYSLPDWLAMVVAPIDELLPTLREMGASAIVSGVEAFVAGANKPSKARSAAAIANLLDRQRKAIAKLDGRLRRILLRIVTPEPSLVLDDQSNTLFGMTRPLASFPQSAIACLWVLAEKSSQEITRKEIIEEGNIETDELNLKVHVSRLNKILKQLAAAACQRPGCTFSLPATNMIVGSRGQTWGGAGPYKLDLEADRVRVRGPRPKWMKRPR